MTPVAPAMLEPDKTTRPPAVPTPLAVGLTVMAVVGPPVWARPAGRTATEDWTPDEGVEALEVTSINVVGVGGAVEEVVTIATLCTMGCEGMVMEGWEELEDSSSSMSIVPRLTALLKSLNWQEEEERNYTIKLS